MSDLPSARQRELDRKHLRPLGLVRVEPWVWSLSGREALTVTEDPSVSWGEVPRRELVIVTLERGK